MHANYTNPAVIELNRCIWQWAAGLAIALIWGRPCASGRFYRPGIVFLLLLIWFWMTLLN
jgi:hypothetical protein